MQRGLRGLALVEGLEGESAVIMGEGLIGIRIEASLEGDEGVLRVPGAPLGDAGQAPQCRTSGTTARARP